MFESLLSTNPVYSYWAIDANLADESEPSATYAAEQIFTAWQQEQITTEELAREVMNMIEEDIESGAVPWDVADFADLHNYVDANMYTIDVMGYLADGDYDDGGFTPTDMVNAVQTRVSEMLCGSTVPGFIEWRPEYESRERRAAFKSRAFDLLIYLESMGNQ
jgi:hypothetical protein